MDNVTHSLTGLALSRIGLGRWCPRATLLLILSANAPDVDVVTAFRGPLAYFEAHRGYTHSLVMLPLMALLTVLLVGLPFRRKLPWLTAYVLACIGVASHLLLDWTNSYGVRLLLPFSPRWFYLDVNALYDVSILAVLLLAAIWPMFARLVSSEIGARGPSGKGSAVFALAFFVFFDIGRAVLHGRAVAQLDARLYDDAPPLRTSALPDRFSPFRWTGIVETEASYLLTPVDTFGDFAPENSEKFYKPPMLPLERVNSTPPFHYLLYFARFPVWSIQPVLLNEGEGTRLELTDLRFGTPGSGSFHCVALQNRNGQLLLFTFTFGSGRDLGWGEGRGTLPSGRSTLWRFRQEFADDSTTQLE